MSKEEKIKALKNPELRSLGLSHPVGKTMSELSEEELANIQGASDVNPETTSACAAITIGIIYSIGICLK